MKRTLSEISAEIEALKSIKPTLPEFSKFNDSHHTAIDAQIETLEKGYEWSEIESKFTVENDHFHASQASDWRNGVYQHPPSVDWATLRK